MGLLDFLKKDKKDEPAAAESVKVVEKKAVVEKKKENITVATKKNTKEAYKILLEPIVTEKSSSTGTYFFRVKRDTNKQEVKKAIQALYGIKPTKVNIINYYGKKVRSGKTSGQQQAWKKAIVYVKAGEKIEIYEGV